MKKSKTQKLILTISLKYRNLILLALSSYYKFYCRFWGIEIGNKCLFWGRTSFNKTENSKIVIGSDCRFRSNSTSNLIGINRPCIISTQGELRPRIQIGNHCGFSGTVIGCFNAITIGDNVNCGANTLITDSDWHLHDPRTTAPKPVNIGNNVWLGVNVVVLKGVSIGNNTVIGANSVVVSNIPANVIAAGNPCRVIKVIDEEIIAKFELNG
jgi:acetyltransferase-like isoleucine patch superfamily enzyme